MKNKNITVIIAVILIAMGVFFVLRHGKSSGLVTKDGKTKSIVNEVQKTFKEQESGENETITYKNSIALDKEITIEFMMHDYANTPDKSESFKEIKENLTPTKGQASFRVKEIGKVKQIDSFNKASKGESFHYLIYEFKGSATNPNSNTIHPRSLKETGWDPAPQFVTVIDGEDDYPGSYWEDNLLELKGYDKVPYNTDFNTADWVTKAAVWKVEDNEEVTYALKYISAKDETIYLKVQ